MKVVFLSMRDWANMGYTYSKSLNSIGIESKSFCMKNHRFEYPEHSIVYNQTHRDYIVNSDVIVFIHSKFIDLQINLSKKIIAVMHAGSTYRQNHKAVNKIFNPIVDITFCGSDVLGFKPKNEVCSQPAIDTEYFKPVYSDFSKSRNMIIGHYPTSPKGYEIISKVINELKDDGENIELRYDSETVSFLNHIKRISECDIYIEDMHDMQGDVPLTAFGITTLECACLGKVVCTRFPDLPIYEKLFGSCGVQVTNNEKELKEKLQYLISLPKEDFIQLQKNTRKWVEERHSLQVIGKWLKTEFEKIKK
jgi:glycosyltransferase involved in cell wall biosynthesis